MLLNISKRLILSTSQRNVNEFCRNISITNCLTSDSVISKRNETKNRDQESRKLLDLKKYHRQLSTLQSTAIPPVARGTVVSKVERREFMAVFPDIVRDLTNSGKYTDLPEVMKRLGKVLQYNVPNGKKNRGLAVVLSYKLLAQNEEITHENIRLAIILGWCVEMLQSYLLICDDMMDGSEKRRGLPCWYRVPDIGLNAINDGLLILCSIYRLLKQYFGNAPYYVNLFETFQEVTLQTAIGQTLDTECLQAGKPRFDIFTMDRYESIVKYKTSYYTFYLPVALALYMAGINDPEMHRQAKTIMLEMGHFFQVQDDFLDCFGDPEVTGKNGTDIQDGKCTWLAVIALQRATPAQRAIMEQSYGSNKPEDIQAIRDLYEKLNIPHIYSIYEEETYNLIRTHIQQISRGLPHELFFKFMDKIYRRDH